MGLCGPRYIVYDFGVAETRRPARRGRTLRVPHKRKQELDPGCTCPVEKRSTPNLVGSSKKQEFHPGCTCLVKSRSTQWFQLAERRGKTDIVTASLCYVYLMTNIMLSLSLRRCLFDVSALFAGFCSPLLSSAPLCSPLLSSALLCSPLLCSMSYVCIDR